MLIEVDLIGFPTFIAETDRYIGLNFSLGIYFRLSLELFMQLDELQFEVVEHG